MTVSIRDAVKAASDTPVIRAGAARIGVANTQWPLLATSSNVVEGKVLSFVDSIYNTTANAASFDDLADYLAISVSGHVLDGWRYLAQAAHALAVGARNQALHLAYYAELRAALSILAGAGIGILKNKHFSLSDTGIVNWFPGQTHLNAWEALKEWAKEPRQAKNVIDCFQAFGFPAKDWAEACSASSSLDAIAGHWLQNWSVDLEKLTDDRELRNEASYRPELTSKAWEPLTIEDLDFLMDLSLACVPVGSGVLESIDNYLIHDLCLKSCELTFGDSSQPNIRRLWNRVFVWLRQHKSLGKREAAKLIRRLKSSVNEHSYHIVTHADPSNLTYLGVFSRAFLLLRLATALMRSQWQKVRLISAGGNCPWQQVLVTSYGRHATLWDSASLPADFEAIDADRVNALDILEEWKRSNGVLNPYQLWRDTSSALHDMCRLERVGILSIVA